jgi:ABC-type amino acid transport substrate-binding protein
MSAQRSLRVICCDLPAPPLFARDSHGERQGYEADVCRLLAQQLGLRVEWAYENWADFYPALHAGRGDIVLCGQGISAYRQTLADFTAPYAVFDEAVMVRSGSPIKAAADLAGKRVGAIANSLNMALAQTFAGAICVPFGGDSDDVLGEMVQALRDGRIDALVDDDVALVPLASEADLAIGFSVATQNRWGIAVAKSRGEWRAQVDAALVALIADGRLREAWQRWMPDLRYPFS